MPRYIVEREFRQGMRIAFTELGAQRWDAVLRANLADRVTWIHSYVSADGCRAFCVYEAPSPAAIRRASSRSSLPLGAITEVSVLEPYFYR